VIAIGQRIGQALEDDNALSPLPCLAPASNGR
jgi:hypothetical protein